MAEQTRGEIVAVRIRSGGEIVCAAHSVKEDGDIYIDDPLHYYLSVVQKALVTDSHHFDHWLWWWKWAVPEGVEIDEFYLS